MSGETKEVFGSNYGQNDVIINGLIDKMTLFDDNLMSLVFGQNIETTELLLRVIMERDIKVIDARTDRPGKFEVANNGSLFLDEIGNLSYHLQAKLLTALQRRSIVRVGSNTPIPINIRLICATNRDLQEMVQKEQFREDLLYRINTIHVEIPPLRERPEDIVPLTEIFITKYTNIYGKKPMALTDDAKEKLKAQPWLGNIRELEHTVEKAIIIADGDTLDGSNFDFPRKREAPVKNDITTLEEMEYTMIKAAMDKFGGNLSLVANQLGISRQTLYNKIKRYEL